MTGTWQLEEKFVEETRYGNFNVHYIRRIDVELKNFYGEERYYQTEVVIRNNQRLASSQYPADTEYAAVRRQGLTKIQ